MLYQVEKGICVVGTEWSTVAVKQFFDENRSEYSTQLCRLEEQNSLGNFSDSRRPKAKVPPMPCTLEQKCSRVRWIDGRAFKVRGRIAVLWLMTR